MDLSYHPVLDKDGAQGLADQLGRRAENSTFSREKCDRSMREVAVVCDNDYMEDGR